MKMHTLNLNRVIFDLFVLWALATIVLSAPAPAPHPWKRHRADVRGLSRPINGPPLSPPTRGDQRRAESDSRTTPPSSLPPSGSPSRPGAAPDLGRLTPSDSSRRTRRHRRSRYRGCRGGVSWARHGDRQPNDLLIGQLNIQSLKPKLADLRHDLSELHRFDVLALCETWTTPSVPTRLLQVDGYKLCRVDWPSHSMLPYGHGVAILTRECYEVEKLPTPVTTATSSNLEIIWCLIRTAKRKRLLIASIYRHPTNTQQQLTADFDDLESQLQHMLITHPDVTLVIAGDLNVCLLQKPTPAATPTPAAGDNIQAPHLQHCNTDIQTGRHAAGRDHHKPARSGGQERRHEVPLRRAA